MNDTPDDELARISESLASLSDTAEGIAVDAGKNGPDSLGHRANTLSKALEAVRSDVQDLRGEVED